ncbi:MAG TPA: LysR substrate-binding domain-containing protein [bacterium]|nr:LysR substrate-binding domain-containing protein [bacterium]
MNVQNFDLNLLLALDALLQEAHVTRAAARIGLSQPAMSNALARLRDLLDDPLLVRTARGMVPTPRAERLKGPIREALKAVERAVADPEAFTPPTCGATFNLMTSDAIGMLMLPQLGARLRREAPGMTLRIHALNDDEPWPSLESGRIDLLAGVYDETPAGVHSQPLYEEQFVCLMRSDHPQARHQLTLEQYVDLPHILIATTRSGQGASLVDRMLEQRGLTRRIALSLPHFLVAPYIVAQSDHVITFPSRLADYFASFLPLRVVEPPLSLPGYSIALFWHERLHREPASIWLREQIARVSRRIGVLDDMGAPRTSVVLSQPS